MRRGQLAYFAEHGAWLRNETLSKIGDDCLRVRFSQLWDSGKNGLDLRAEYKSTALLCVEERFFAQAIATQHQPATGLIP